jgi:hypothetical protein
MEVKIGPFIDSSPRILPRLLLFAVHTVSWLVVRFGGKASESFWVYRIAEGAIPRRFFSATE